MSESSLRPVALGALLLLACDVEPPPRGAGSPAPEDRAETDGPCARTICDAFDLNGDGIAGSGDIVQMFQTCGNEASCFPDLNADGNRDTTDIVFLFQHVAYESSCGDYPVCEPQFLFTSDEEIESLRIRTFADVAQEQGISLDNWDWTDLRNGNGLLGRLEIDEPVIYPNGMVEIPAGLVSDVFGEEEIGGTALSDPAVFERWVAAGLYNPASTVQRLAKESYLEAAGIEPVLDELDVEFLGALEGMPEDGPACVGECNLYVETRSWTAEARAYDGCAGGWTTPETVHEVYGNCGSDVDVGTTARPSLATNTCERSASVYAVCQFYEIGEMDDGTGPCDAAACELEGYSEASLDLHAEADRPYVEATSFSDSAMTAGARGEVSAMAWISGGGGVPLHTLKAEARARAAGHGCDPSPGDIDCQFTFTFDLSPPFLHPGYECTDADGDDVSYEALGEVFCDGEPVDAGGYLPDAVQDVRIDYTQPHLPDAGDVPTVDGVPAIQRVQVRLDGATATSAGGFRVATPLLLHDLTAKSAAYVLLEPAWDEASSGPHSIYHGGQALSAVRDASAGDVLLGVRTAGGLDHTPAGAPFACVKSDGFVPVGFEHKLFGGEATYFGKTQEIPQVRLQTSCNGFPLVETQPMACAPGVDFDMNAASDAMWPDSCTPG